MDVAVVIPTVLRSSLVDALRSVFAQRFAGTIQVLVGLDQPIGDLSLVDAACESRPANCSVQVVYPGYSTSVRHGGLCPARDGGVLRCILTYLANSPYVAYLDDDNWWDEDHLQELRRAIEGQDWAFSLRWFVHPLSRRPICVDEWESVGPGKGDYVERFGGFVDPSCLMIDKRACADAVPSWNYPLPSDPRGMSGDRRVFAALRRHQRFACTGKATAFYQLDPDDVQHAPRLRHMGDLYEQAGIGGSEPQIVQTRAEAPVSVIGRDLMQLLHGGDIYQGFDQLLPRDIQGWNSINSIFEDVVRSIKPRVVIDVGVWKGGSTLYLADLMRQYGVDGAVIGVDTFLGSPEHWDRDGEFSESLKKRHGFPLLYYQFISNVIHCRHTERVIPLPQSSENAAVILRRAKIKADVIHVDAAHEYGPVRRDLDFYWELLQPGGYLIGDDYTSAWPGVIRAANDFAADIGLTLRLSPPK